MSTICENYPNIASCADPDRWAGAESFFGGESPLALKWGYLVVLGFGALFSIFTTILVFVEKYFGENATMTSEHFK